MLAIKQGNPNGNPNGSSCNVYRVDKDLGYDDVTYQVFRYYAGMYFNYRREVFPKYFRVLKER